MEIKKLKIGQVIYIDFPHNSFKWANGLKIIVNKTKNDIDIVSINEQGKLSLFNNGFYMTSTTSINNPGIKIIEGLTYKVDKNLL